MKKQLLGALCALGLMALGCDNAKVKSEAHQAAEHLQEAGHETVEAGKAVGRAAEAAGHEAAEKIEAETEHLKGDDVPTSEQPADTK